MFLHLAERFLLGGSGKTAGVCNPAFSADSRMLGLVKTALRTPTDVFPDIGIPVVAVVWQYNGLSPDAMAGRVIYTYERSLSTIFNDIEHIESQSLPGMGIVKIFFQPGVDIRTANAQVTAVTNRAQADATGHYAAADPQLQRLHGANLANGVLQPQPLGSQDPRPCAEQYSAWRLTSRSCGICSRKRRMSKRRRTRRNTRNRWR